MQDDEFKQYLSLVYDDVNVTNTKPLKEMGKILLQLVIILFIFYISVYIFSGIVLKNLSAANQVKLEKFIAASSKIKTMEIDKKDVERLQEAKNIVLKTDKTFPKTSNLNIGIINEKQKNALCLPDGTIYITSELYKLLDDEMLLFTISHEMGHYKNKDHLMQLRKHIAIDSVLILISILTASDDDVLSQLASNVMEFENLNYSRGVEAKADLYAKQILLENYNNVNGAVRTLEVLKDKRYPIDLTIFSTHPSIERRIEKMLK